MSQLNSEPMGIRFFPSSKVSMQLDEAQAGRVAIITRTKNRPVLLVRAFASMLSQIHENWHLYLVNDGGDPDVVDELVSDYRAAFRNRITVFHNEQSLGMESASNVALSNSQGQFVAIHDDDDAWHPEFLSDTINFLNYQENQSYAAVITSCTVVHEKMESDRVIEISRESWGYWRPHVDMMALLSRNMSPPICFLIRKSVCDAIGAFNSALPVLGDWDYNIRLLMFGDIGTINKPLAYYHQRIQPDSDLYTNSVRAIDDKHKLYDVLYRNSLLRPLLQREPGYVGVLHVLLRQAEDNQSSVLQQLNRESGWGHDRHLDLHNVTHDMKCDLERLERSVERIEALLTEVVRAVDLEGLERSVERIEALQAAMVRPVDLEGLERSAERTEALLATVVRPVDLERLERSVERIEALLTAVLRPVRAIWRRLIPLRRLVARLRGRI